MKTIEDLMNIPFNELAYEIVIGVASYVSQLGYICDTKEFRAWVAKTRHEPIKITMDADKPELEPIYHWANVEELNTPYEFRLMCESALAVTKNFDMHPADVVITMRKTYCDIIRKFELLDSYENLMKEMKA